mgnify:FL=1
MSLLNGSHNQEHSANLDYCRCGTAIKLSVTHQKKKRLEYSSFRHGISS